MSHSPDRHRCPRPVCAGTVAPHARRGRAADPYRPMITPGRTPVRRPLPGRCRAVLEGHRTPGEIRLLAQQMAEVLVGRRAPEALRDRSSPAVREELRRLRGALPCRSAPRLERVFHQRSGDRLEVGAVIACDLRSRAFAFGARRRGGAWVCTDLETDGSL
ncbi:Rv3235 family protein [Nocardiopsis sp. N85]|uniref:Rv3235 family protein n=1 Tax=Nocardiopsis sp. N85 TaxID=3029400 RepID=UPI00237F82F8|nr:Rv3235 family protein [Nocardiopsis sp. N85]MDE3724224.1 Rv3235 family protein [Nocardiopsis sp. N85]